MRTRTSTDLPVSKIVGLRVHQLRTARGLSVQALSRLTARTGPPLGRPAIYAIERGEHARGGLRAVRVDELAALADALDVDAATLMRQPDCEACLDDAPEGFTCQACGGGG